jgi:hypothetical protein
MIPNETGDDDQIDAVSSRHGNAVLERAIQRKATELTGTGGGGDDKK